MFALIFPLMLSVVDLGEHFSKGDAWRESAVDFAIGHQKDSFGFASLKCDVIDCRGRGHCTWFGLDVWETRIFYATGGATRVEMSLYNRGDDKDSSGLSSEELGKLLDDIASKAQPGGKIGANPEKKKLGTGGFQLFKKWSGGDYVVDLTWGVSGAKTKEQTADYVRVTIYPKGGAVHKAEKSVKKPVSGVVAKAKVRSHVKKNAEGDVWIDGVPMVDQGQKGYCSAATSERVLRYYGHDVDEHEIAQSAMTTAQGGTLVPEMKEAVRNIGSKCRLGFVEIVSMSDSIGDRKMRMKDSRYKKFLNGVKTQVDQGIPVFWGVTLGLFPEPMLPQASGGHMRLIVGYNLKTHEILYSDSWGAGHELKRMPEDWAFAITHDAFFLKPL
jgi:hypothetical protein